MTRPHTFEAGEDKDLVVGLDVGIIVGADVRDQPLNGQELRAHT